HRLDQEHPGHDGEVRVHPGAAVAEQVPGLPRGGLTVARPRWLTTALRGIAVAVAALAVWELLYRVNVLDNGSFPSAVGAVKALGTATTTSEFWSAVWRTLEAWALGLLIGTAAGVAVGVLTGLNEFAYRSLNLLVEFLKTVPVVAALPLAILVFGTTVKM